MHRFSIFVDGSNLFGTLKHLGVYVDNYFQFYRYIFDRAADEWSKSFAGNRIGAAQLHRIYWYVVGNMDEWDLASPKAQTHLRSRFDADKEIKRIYMPQAGEKLQTKDQCKVADEAWALCFKEFQEWYVAKKNQLVKMHKFYHAVRAATDYIEIIECGHWKVDLLHRNLLEKGLDTSLAVDMLALKKNYDVAILLSGDADTIPSINYIKKSNKHVASVEFLKGYPPEKKGKQFSSQIRLSSDFVIQIYEMDLVNKKLARSADVDVEMERVTESQEEED